MRARRRVPHRKTRAPRRRSSIRSLVRIPVRLRKGERAERARLALNLFEPERLAQLELGAARAGGPAASVGINPGRSRPGRPRTGGDSGVPVRRIVAGLGGGPLRLALRLVADALLERPAFAVVHRPRRRWRPDGGLVFTGTGQRSREQCAAGTRPIALSRTGLLYWLTDSRREERRHDEAIRADHRTRWGHVRIHASIPGRPASLRHAHACQCSSSAPCSLWSARAHPAALGGRPGGEDTGGHHKSPQAVRAAFPGLCQQMRGAAWRPRAWHHETGGCPRQRARR